MGTTHENIVRGIATTVVSLVVLSAVPAHAVDRQAAARAAAAAVQRFATSANPYTGAAAQVYEAQRALTVQALGGNNDAASQTQSQRAAAGRGAVDGAGPTDNVATTSALTQPVTLPQGTSTDMTQSTALSGTQDQSSLLSEIALTGASNVGATQDAISTAEQNGDDIIAAVTANSNKMILMLQKSFQTQLAARKAAEAAAAQEQADQLAKAPKRKKVRDHLGGGVATSNNTAGSGRDLTSNVSADVQTATQEIIGNLDEAKKPFLGRDNIAASANRQ